MFQPVEERDGRLFALAADDDIRTGNLQVVIGLRRGAVAAENVEWPVL